MQYFCNVGVPLHLMKFGIVVGERSLLFFQYKVAVVSAKGKPRFVRQVWGLMVLFLGSWLDRFPQCKIRFQPFSAHVSGILESLGR